MVDVGRIGSKILSHLPVAFMQDDIHETQHA